MKNITIQLFSFSLADLIIIHLGYIYANFFSDEECCRYL